MMKTLKNTYLTKYELICYNLLDIKIIGLEQISVN